MSDFEVFGSQDGGDFGVNASQAFLYPFTASVVCEEATVAGQAQQVETGGVAAISGPAVVAISVSRGSDIQCAAVSGESTIAGLTYKGIVFTGAAVSGSASVAVSGGKLSLRPQVKMTYYSPPQQITYYQR